ncbi:MAG: 50S ribosomal protein L11 methyltransferase [Bacteroidetes bacterium]|nr:50S ribosomal protein L11 methyltransferase [Bacteroidota bacterium]
MSYFRVTLSYDRLTLDEGLITALLMEKGFDSFEDTEDGVIAYIPDNEWNRNKFEAWLANRFQDGVTLISCEPLMEKNWNEVWESNFSPVTIAGLCLVRAPFHPPDPAYPLEIVIEPKMSFGTAHHETTSLVMELMLGLDMKGQRLLDMGCGTGILAILAVKLGADSVLAIDNDYWAFENSKENIIRNQVDNRVTVVLGDAKTITGRHFQLIIANINRNILLTDMKIYGSCLEKGGSLILSGFYDTDIAAIEQETAKQKLSLLRYLEKNHWIAAVFIKN